MKAVNESAFKIEGSFNLQFRLGNQPFWYRVYIIFGHQRCRLTRDGLSSETLNKDFPR